MLTAMRALSKASRGLLTMRNNCVPLIIRYYSSDTSSRLRSTVSSLPLLRLGFQVIYRISRPLADRIVQKAQQNKLFSDYVCIPLGKGLHWADVKIRLRLLDLKGLNIVPPIEDKKAAEMGSQLILEFIVILIFSAIVVFEYNRTLQKEEKKDNKRKQDFNEIQSTIEELEKTIELQSTQLETLSKLLSCIKGMS